MQNKEFDPSFADVVNLSLLEEAKRSIQLSGLFTKRQSSGAAKNVLNKLLASHPEYVNTIMGIVMYPALQWSLYGEQINDVIKFAEKSDDQQGMTDTEHMLRDTFGFGNQLKLREREAYFVHCHQILDLINDTMPVIRRYPKFGTQMECSLHLLMDIGEEDGAGVSRYEVNKYTPMAIEALYLKIGESLNELVPSLISPVKKDFTDLDDEFLYVYHNVKLLLKEYSRLCWVRDDAADGVTKILHCKTPEQVLKVSSRIDLIYSADVVIQFLLLISGSIALIKYYPVNGERYSDLLKALVANRNVTLANGQSAFIREQELAKALNIQPGVFSKMKKEAFALLGLLLWGYDGQVLMSILTDNETGGTIYDA